MHSSPALRAFLPGTWEVRRTLKDLTSGTKGTFNGTATFTKHDDDGALLHREHGTLAWAGLAPTTATRALTWRPGIDDYSMNVFFEDGRFFHALNLENGSDTPEHLCQPDLYRGSFAIKDSDSWNYTWRVTGPNKNLRLTTRLSRQPDQTTSAR
ncbi:DUF6314 family protein [Arthrobacter tecti]